MRLTKEEIAWIKRHAYRPRKFIAPFYSIEQKTVFDTKILGRLLANCAAKRLRVGACWQPLTSSCPQQV